MQRPIAASLNDHAARRRHLVRAHHGSAARLVDDVLGPASSRLALLTRSRETAALDEDRQRVALGARYRNARAAAAPAASAPERGAGRHHRRAAGVNRFDDLGVVDALVDRGDAEVAVAELALDDDERHALVGHSPAAGAQLLAYDTAAAVDIPLRLAVIGRDGGSEIVLRDMRTLIDADVADGFTAVLRGLAEAVGDRV